MFNQGLSVQGKYFNKPFKGVITHRMAPHPLSTERVEWLQIQLETPILLNGFNRETILFQYDERELDIKRYTHFIEVLK